MKSGKVKVGFAGDEQIVKQLDSIVKRSRNLVTSRLGTVGVILVAPFEGQYKPLKKKNYQNNGV